MPITNMNCDKEHLVKDFIRRYGNEPFTVSDCYLHQVFKVSDERRILVNESFILSKYRTELAQYLEKMEFTDEQYMKYRYNPKLFSYDLYGTTEMWQMVLYANEIYSASAFSMRTVRYYNPNVFTIMTRALDLEKPFTDINEAEVEDILKRPPKEGTGTIRNTLGIRGAIKNKYTAQNQY